MCLQSNVFHLLYQLQLFKTWIDIKLQKNGYSAQSTKQSDQALQFL